jgi:hypothetical protein
MGKPLLKLKAITTAKAATMNKTATRTFARNVIFGLAESLLAEVLSLSVP